MTAFADAVARIRHRKECQGGEPQLVTLSFGDQAARCPGCTRWATLDRAQDRRLDEPEPVPVRAPEPVRPRVGYCCRTHQDQLVNWRGRGCPRCREEERQRQDGREARRRRHRDASRTVEQPWAYV